MTFLKGVFVLRFEHLDRPPQVSQACRVHMMAKGPTVCHGSGPRIPPDAEPVFDQPTQRESRAGNWISE